MATNSIIKMPKYSGNTIYTVNDFFYVVTAAAAKSHIMNASSTCQPSCPSLSDSFAKVS